MTPAGCNALLYNDRGELIRAQLSTEGYKEFERFKLLEGTYPFSGGKFAWPPPSFANRHLFVRNDKEVVCVSLAAEP
jgi:hypothetical protein